jgi:hypothetical protein
MHVSPRLGNSYLADPADWAAPACAAAGGGTGE